MAHGVEGRTPFLDPEVAKVAFRLPDRAQDPQAGSANGCCASGWPAQLPEADAFGRKHGFTVPVAQWIARQGDRLGPLVAASPGVAEICLPDR